MTKTISVKELRQNFPRIRKELLKGNSFIIIYRSKPLAEVKPLTESQISFELKPAKKINRGLVFFAHPPKKYMFKSKKSPVDIIREERESQY